MSRKNSLAEKARRRSERGERAVASIAKAVCRHCDKTELVDNPSRTCFRCIGDAVSRLLGGK